MTVVSGAPEGFCKARIAFWASAAGVSAWITSSTAAFFSFSDSGKKRRSSPAPFSRNGALFASLTQAEDRDRRAADPGDDRQRLAHKTAGESEDRRQHDDGDDAEIQRVHGWFMARPRPGPGGVPPARQAGGAAATGAPRARSNGRSRQSSAPRHSLPGGRMAVSGPRPRSSQAWR